MGVCCYRLVQTEEEMQTRKSSVKLYYKLRQNTAVHAPLSRDLTILPDVLDISLQHNLCHEELLLELSAASQTSEINEDVGVEKYIKNTIYIFAINLTNENLFLSLILLSRRLQLPA